MEPHPRPGPADPEFDAPLVRSVRLRDFDPVGYQRVVINPFLAVLALVIWWPIVGWLLRGPFPPWSVLATLALIGLPYLVQYHCLDCGRTGISLRLGRHACSGVQSRWRDDGVTRFPFPSARSQMIFWAYLIGSVALLLAVRGVNPP